MTTKKITALTAAAAMDDSDLFILAQGDDTLVKGTLADLVLFIANNLGALASADAGTGLSLVSGLLSISSIVARRDADNTFGDHAVSRFSAVISEKTDDYTLLAADNGTIIFVNKATAVTVTLSDDLPEGFNCVVVQEGAGTVSFSAMTGATLQSPDGKTSISGQYKSASLLVKENADDASADWRLDGALS
jgi:hypothetical protein